MQAAIGDQYILQLIRELKAGSEHAAERIYRLYGKAMFNTLMRMTNHSAEAEDLLQEAFIRAFKNIDQFQGSATFGAWLKRIVVNTGLEALRKRKLEVESLESLSDVQHPEVEEDNMNWNEVLSDIRIVEDAICKLPEGSKKIVILYLLEGYTHDEIGEILNISPSTSKTQYMRGKKLLKEQILSRHERRSV